MFWTNLYFIKPVNVSLDTTKKDFLKINQSKSAGAKGDVPKIAFPDKDQKSQS